MILKLELNTSHEKDPDAMLHSGNLKNASPYITTPPIGRADYWLHRVKLYKDQAIISFCKFYTLGIGFFIEDADWNTNLPYCSTAEEIYNHIKHNKKYKEITKTQCIEAIKMIQERINKHVQFEK